MKFFKEEHDKGKKGDFEMTDGDYYNDFDKIDQYDGITGIKEEEFGELGKKINTIPDSFHAHKYIKEIYS